MTGRKKIRIMIVDDLDRVRQDLRIALELIDDFEVVCEATDGGVAIRQAEKFSPDIVLMDLNMPEKNGFDATLQIKQRHLAGGVVILTIYDDFKNRHQAQKVGADAFLIKGAPISTFETTIRQVWNNSLTR
jgi:DNA-binding NarL/FixJ family response regulator